MGSGKSRLATALIRPFTDSDVTWPILFYEVPAPHLGELWTVFTERQWDERDEHWSGVPGLVYHSIRYLAGNAPPAPNGPPCGQPDWYTAGLSHAVWSRGGYGGCGCPVAWDGPPDVACACASASVTQGTRAPACACGAAGRSVACACGVATVLQGEAAFACACGVATVLQGSPAFGCACGTASVTQGIPAFGCACGTASVTQGTGPSLGCVVAGQPTTLFLDVSPTLPGAAGPFTLTKVGGSWSFTGTMGTQGGTNAVLSCASPNPWFLSLSAGANHFNAGADSGTGTAPIDTFWHSANMTGWGGSATSTLHVHT